MSEPLVRVYSEQTKKVKYVTPAQVVLLKGLGYEPQAEPEKLEPIILQQAIEIEPLDEKMEVVLKNNQRELEKPIEPKAKKEPQTVKPKTTKKNAA
jgi:hypothetical protein